MESKGYKVAKTFRSWGAYLANARTFKPGSSSSGENQPADPKWAGTKTIGEALAMADKGWKEGARLVGDTVIPIVENIAHAHATDGGWAWDVTGADYDVGELQTGAPECWLTPSDPSVRPVITISANVTTSCGIPKRMIELRGAAVAALTMALQSAGYIVRVYKVEGYPVDKCGDPPTFHRVCLTDDNGGPLDTDRLVFALAHPAAARQIGYSTGAILGGGKQGSMLWAPSDPPKDLGWHGDIYLPAAQLADANWNDEESVGRWVESQYERLTKPQKQA